MIKGVTSNEEKIIKDILSKKLANSNRFKSLVSAENIRNTDNKALINNTRKHEKKPPKNNFTNNLVGSFSLSFLYIYIPIRKTGNTDTTNSINSPILIKPH